MARICCTASPSNELRSLCASRAQAAVRDAVRLWGCSAVAAAHACAMPTLMPASCISSTFTVLDSSVDCSAGVAELVGACCLHACQVALHRDKGCAVSHHYMHVIYCIAKAGSKRPGSASHPAWHLASACNGHHNRVAARGYRRCRPQSPQRRMCIIIRSGAERTAHPYRPKHSAASSSDSAPQAHPRELQFAKSRPESHSRSLYDLFARVCAQYQLVVSSCDARWHDAHKVCVHNNAAPGRNTCRLCDTSTRRYDARV